MSDLISSARIMNSLLTGEGFVFAEQVAQSTTEALSTGYPNFRGFNID